MESAVANSEVALVCDELAQFLIVHIDAETLIQDKIAVHPLLYDIGNFVLFHTILKEAFLEEKHLSICIW